MTQERLVFANSIEGLFIKGVGDRLTPEIKTELRALGIDVDKPLLPAYPSSAYQRGIEILAKHLHPDVPIGEAQFALGERAVLGITETVVGKTAVVLSKLVGPRRSLLRFPVSAMSSTNFSKIEARELSPTEVEIVSVPFEGHVSFLRGAVSAVIVLTGGKEPKVAVMEHDPKAERAVVRASWTA